MFEKGSWQIGVFRGVPIRLHWSLPLGALVFSRGRIMPGLWIAIFLVIFLHEAGHALMVWRFGLRNRGILITGFGGSCAWSGAPSPIERALVAWGGVFAQFALLAIAAPIYFILRPFGNAHLNDFVYGLVEMNLVLALFNLIPFPPLDGAEAWPLFKHLYSRAKLCRRNKERKKKAKNKNEDAMVITLREALKEAEKRDRDN